MSTFTTGDLQIAYLDSGDGFPVIFQHGLGNNKERVHPLLAGLPGLRVISFDCPSHGASSPAKPGEDTFARYGDVFFALLDHLGIERAVFGGVSMGAALSLHCALRSPERCAALMMIRPAWCNAPMPRERQDIFRALAGFLQHEDGRAAYLDSDVYRFLALKHQATADSFLPFFDHPGADKAAGKLLSLPADTPNQGADCLEELHNVPALVLGCAGDYIHPLEVAQEMAICLPNARFYQLPSSLDDRESSNAELRSRVRDFLADVQQGRPSGISGVE